MVCSLWERKFKIIGKNIQFGVEKNEPKIKK
jgi:hypothetical protein